MNSAASPSPPDRQGGTRPYVAAVLRLITWKAVLITQVLGFVFAITPWLELVGAPQPKPSFLFLVTEQVLTAGWVMLAALAGEEAVRRGWSVLRAFFVVLLCASGAVALVQWAVNDLIEIADPERGVSRLLYTFLNVGALWGTALLVYMNRQSAARLLARVRAGELARAQAERGLIASDLAATEAQIDPVSVLQRLSQVRGLYAANSPDADTRFEVLIADLRSAVAASATVQPTVAPLRRVSTGAEPA